MSFLNIGSLIILFSNKELTSPVCPPLPSHSKGSISLGGLREGRRYTKPCRGTGAYGPGDPTKRCVDAAQQILQV